MDIKYIGHSSFYIRTKNAKIVTDPFDPVSTGLKFPKIEADIVTISHGHSDHNYMAGIKGEPLELTWPGEFEKMEVRIHGYRSFHDKNQGAERGENVMYKFEADDYSVLHCGDIGHSLPEALVEEIGNVDVLLIPVGGIYTVNPEEAVKIVNEIEPSIVIPMHYHTEGLNPETFKDLSPLSAFLKEIGAEDAQPTDKFTLKREELNSSEMKVVVLSTI